MTTNRDTAAIARIDELLNLLNLQQVSDPTESFSRIQNLLHSPRTLWGSSMDLEACRNPVPMTMTRS